MTAEEVKLRYIHFFAETSSMQNGLRLGMEYILSVKVDWEHVFDTEFFSRLDTNRTEAAE